MTPLRHRDWKLIASILECGGGTFTALCRWHERRAVSHMSDDIANLIAHGYVEVIRPHKPGRHGNPGVFGPSSKAWAWAERIARGEEPDEHGVLSTVVEALEMRESEAAA